MIQINIKELAEIKEILSELKKMILDKSRSAEQTIFDNKGLMEYLKMIPLLKHYPKVTKGLLS